MEPPAPGGSRRSGDSHPQELRGAVEPQHEADTRRFRTRGCRTVRALDRAPSRSMIG
jgi:hypothetical protein